MSPDEYRDYLASPHWRRLRADALRASGGRCEGCGSAHRLEVHHRDYARIGGESLDDVRVLCRGCHERAHERARLRRETLADATDHVAVGLTADHDDEPALVGDLVAIVVAQLGLTRGAEPGEVEP